MKFRNPASTEPPVIAGAADGGPYVEGTLFEVVTNVAHEVIESVGPTGSGADNIWTALDGVPTGIDYLLLGMVLSVRHATLGAGLFVTARSLDGSVDLTNLASATVIGRLTAPANASFGTVISLGTLTPVNAANVFEIRWSRLNAGNATEIINLSLRGYGVNGVIT